MATGLEDGAGRHRDHGSLQDASQDDRKFGLPARFLERALWVVACGTGILAALAWGPTTPLAAADFSFFALGILLCAVMVSASLRRGHVSTLLPWLVVVSLSLSVAAGFWNKRHEQSIDLKFIADCIAAGRADACEDARVVCDYKKWRGAEPAECAAVRQILKQVEHK